MDEPEITLRISISEFVVLDEFLRRLTLAGRLAIEDEAEMQALCNLECLFEREPSRGDDSWPSLEEAARSIAARTMTAPRRWFRFSLRTLFVLATVCAVSTAQWMRAERLQKRAREHKMASGVAALAAGTHSDILNRSAEVRRRREARDAYFKDLANYNAEIVAKCRRAIWRPWIELWPVPVAPENPPGPQTGRL